MKYWLLLAWLLSFQQSSADECVIRAVKLVGETNLSSLFLDKQFAKTQGLVDGHYKEFLLRFRALYSSADSQLNRKERELSQKWAVAISEELDPKEQTELVGALRRWVIIMLRDVAGELDPEGQKLIAKRILAFENIFSKYAPRIANSFCLDAEIASNPKDARTFLAGLRKLKKDQGAIKKFSTGREQDLVKAINQHPTVPDLWYFYASLLFSQGKLEAAQEKLDRLFRLSPDHKDGAELQRNIRLVVKIKNPIERMNKIVAITAIEVENATARFEKRRDKEIKSKSRQPANR